jgi:hypothetical protein
MATGGSAGRPEEAAPTIAARSPGPAGSFVLLLRVAVVGVLWELRYHLLMQWRREKDWPTLFGLVEGVREGVLI